MGVPMVQKQVKRRTSLVLGAVLALLLGVAAGFLILALPIAMLETVTTSIALSKLMIQAEPPISPNDRTVLAVLAAIVTASVGWVLVDWLLFGRVGMTTLIRPREDEYEDDDDSFRPTDPLDLITPVDVLQPATDWSGPAATGDARRPLSARTDIGDPPAPMPTPGASPVFGASAIDQLLPPIDQILPGMSAPAAPPADPFAAFSQAGFASPPPAMPQPTDPFAAYPAENPLPAVETPLDLPAAAAFAPPPPAVSGMPDWLPSPGIRPEPVSEDVPDVAAEEVEPEVAEVQPPQPPVFPTMAEPAAPPPFAPPPFAMPPLVEPAPSPMPEFPVMPQPQAIVPPPLPIAPLPVPPAPVAEQGPVEPLVPAMAPVPQQPVPAPPPALVPAPPPAAYTPPAPVAPLPVPAPSALLGNNAPLDRAMIDDLLTRLEKGMRNRRAATASGLPKPQAAPVEQASPPAAPAPLVPPPQAFTAPPMQSYAPPPEAYAPPPQEQAPMQNHAPAPVWPPVVDMPFKRPPPAGFAMNDLPAPPPIAPLYVPPTPAAPEPQPSAANGDQMIDQPLHITLDQLRGMVRR